MLPLLSVWWIAATGFLLPPDRARGDEGAVVQPVPPGGNAFCPVTTDEAADARYSAEYGGLRVYFCCGKCRKKFDADPAAYASHLFSSALPAAPAPTVAPWLHLAGKLHPLAVHFPIALLLAAAVAEAMHAARKGPDVSAAARFCLGLAACGAPLAAAFGWSNSLSSPVAASAAGLLAWHRALGWTTAAAAAGLYLLVRRARSPGVRRGYRLLLGTAAAAVAVTGHLGGLLANGADYFSGL